VAGELEAGADFHFAVHNAAGMVSVQEGISVTEALIRLRAFAFSNDRLLADVAEDVVARRLGWDEPRSSGRWRGAGRYYDGMHGPGAGPAPAGCDGPLGAQEGELR
jgi:hypothetical protein